MTWWMICAIVYVAAIARADEMRLHEDDKPDPHNR